ncbi:MAG: hypothetical protein EU535_05820 [Promethearchaeota archaeon]|nr:MAG: hypothetical protein EU535_05820 [Candidatus Lokiarchaeota archaeon]
MFEEKNENNGEQCIFIGLCEIYLLFYDEIRGHVPLLVYPDESVKDDEEKMRPVNYHSIWFLNKKEDAEYMNIDLEYGDKTYFATKLYLSSKRKKRRAGLSDDSPEVIVIMVALPIDMNIFGDDLLSKMTTNIVTNFKDSLCQIISSEIEKSELTNLNLASPQIKKIIQEGDIVKEKIRNDIKNTCMDYFSSVIKQKDSNSIKKQKAISYLSLKGIDINYVISNNENINFSDMKLFDQSKKPDQIFEIKTPFEISSVCIIKETSELEIMVKNNKEIELNNLLVKIAHIKDYFERQILDHSIECWYPNEDILFTLPLLPEKNEYLFLTIENSHKTKYLSKKIELEHLI